MTGGCIKNNMTHHLHHVHIFASDLKKSIEFYRQMFSGKVILDMEVAGARNVFMRIGNGRIHLYDQPPRISGRGSIHHFGIQTQDIDGDMRRMKEKGIVFKKDINDQGYMKYIMVPAPDDIVVELFQVNKSTIPKEYQDYFDWD